jgi:hypothetical protein
LFTHNDSIARCLWVSDISILFYAPSHDSFVSKQKLSDSVTLYITKYDDGGATVSDVYRFYLDKDNSGNIMKALEDRSPFLEANTSNVTACLWEHGKCKNHRQGLFIH